MSAQAAPAKVAEQITTQSPVLLKLVIFAVCLGLAPIATYYASRDFFFDGNGTYAAITAIAAANIVLVTYIIVAVQEDGREEKTKAAIAHQARKDQ